MTVAMLGLELTDDGKMFVAVVGFILVLGILAVILFPPVVLLFVWIGSFVRDYYDFMEHLDDKLRERIDRKKELRKERKKLKKMRGDSN